jgi:hypothetical protein
MLQRTIITASGLPYPKVQWKALDEIQVGGEVWCGVVGAEWRAQGTAVGSVCASWLHAVKGWHCALAANRLPDGPSTRKPPLSAQPP